MIGTDIVVAGTALVAAVAVGLAAHELTHAVALRLFGIDHAITYFPGRSDGIVGALTSRPWAAVHPRPTGREPALHLRAAALAPALLAVPVFAAGFGGVVPAESPVATAIAIGWLACAIPSPQDFSVVFHAHRVLETETSADPNAALPGSRAD